MRQIDLVFRAQVIFDKGLFELEIVGLQAIDLLIELFDCLVAVTRFLNHLFGKIFIEIVAGKVFTDILNEMNHIIYPKYYLLVLLVNYYLRNHLTHALPYTAKSLF